MNGTGKNCNMKINQKEEPRIFSVGIHDNVEIKDCGTVEGGDDEMLTFVSPAGKEYDVVCKEWGFYATPSVNGRLVKQGFKTALVRNSKRQYFIMIVDRDKTSIFETYCMDQKQEVIEWLDEK